MNCYILERVVHYFRGFLGLRYFAALAGLAACGISAEAASVCLGPNASGNGSGTDWNNVAAWSSVSLTRGNVYYLQAGSYGAKLFSTPLSQSVFITIKKATATDHVTDTGWASTMGTGQAVLSAPLKFVTGYWILDGGARNESNWFDGTGYGIKVLSAAGDYGQSVKVGGVDADGSYDYTGASANSVQLKYCYMAAQVMPPGVAYRSYQIDCESGYPTTGLLFSHCYVTNGNNHFFLRNTLGAIVEFCASNNAKNDSVNHGEIFNLYYNANSAVIRYNKVFDCYDPGYSENAQGYYAGTAIAAIVTSSNCQIYGNLFVNCCSTDGAIGWNGTRAGYGVPNLVVCQNTIIGGWGAQGVMLETSSTGCGVYNNVWFGNTPSFATCAHDYNAAAASLGEANGQVLTSGIFTRYTGDSSGDYTLTAHTSPGTSVDLVTGLAANLPDNTDMLGNPRNAGGIRDRGAYEYGSATPTPTPTPASTPKPPTGLHIITP